jgi:2-keto-4-pentenoate hydratase/2-oxohepta-3-ene-1,7-dioic acid hydratase in catechol pathway
MTIKICRFVAPLCPEPTYAEVHDDALAPFGSGDPFSGYELRGERIPLSDARILVPVSPSKIVCVGRNYLEHAAELGNKMPDEPLLFLKPPSALVGPGQEIRIPVQSQQVEYEGEIGVVVGRRASYLTENDDPFEYVYGYTAVNDVTARDLQRKDVQFTRGKSFDTFCPVGPVIARGLAHENLTVQTRVNGVVKQHGSSSQMAFSIAFLIRYISNIMTLFPGDLIATGTPAGVSKLSPGDEVDITVSGVGTLRNRVV